MAAPISVVNFVKRGLNVLRFCKTSSLKPAGIDKVVETKRPSPTGAKFNEICEHNKSRYHAIRSTSGGWHNSRTPAPIHHGPVSPSRAFNPHYGHHLLPADFQSQPRTHDIVRLYCVASRSCWKCHAGIELADKRGVQFFCEACSAIQPVNPDSNYFQTMQCDEVFDLDAAKLTQTFRNLQRKLHPDKFTIMSKREQGYSAMQSSEVNKAYSTLLKPLSRGLYLLELNGLTIEEGNSRIEPDFLMEVMEINESLAETGDEATVRQIGKDNAGKLGAFLKKLSQAFSEKDYPRAREILMRLKYFSNIDDKVKDQLEQDF